MIDIWFKGRDPYEDYQIINEELKAYEHRLEDRHK